MVVEVIRAHLAKPEVASKSRPDTPYGGVPGYGKVAVR